MGLFLGLMSGTSMDGIDVALIERTDVCRFLAGHTYPYTPALKQMLSNILEHAVFDLTHFFQSHHWVGEAFANAAIQFMAEERIDKRSILAIGSHGQTILHAPEQSPGFTVQLGCGHTISAMTQCTVVADFRTRDVVLGGQGAPLAPLFHKVLFEHIQKPLGVLNLGGIANLTYLDVSGAVRGYDVGPGNVLLDYWISKSKGDSFDKDGVWGASGQVITELLSRCLKDPYFELRPPKSLDKLYFSKHWLSEKLLPHYLPHDVQATLVCLSAHAVRLAYQRERIKFKTLLVCGGGAHNQTLMQELSKQLSSVDVVKTDTLGIHSDYLEAMMCGWLASSSLAGEMLDLSGITGGQKTVLGCIYPHRTMS